MLIVDDEEGPRLSLRVIFKDDYEVLMASDGAAAIELAQKHRIEEQIATTRGEIYASIIHDINGPLTVISGFVQLMNQRFGNAQRMGVEDLEFIKDRLKIITRQVTNCIEISRRYLGFLRKQADEAPRVPVNQLMTDLHQLVNVHP